MDPVFVFLLLLVFGAITVLWLLGLTWQRNADLEDINRHLRILFDQYHYDRRLVERYRRTVDTGGDD